MTSSSYSHVQGNEQAPLRSSSVSHTATHFQGAFWRYRYPAIRENVGNIALRSGPLLYCLESSDNALPLHQICVPASATFEKQFVPDLLGGIILLRSEVQALGASDWTDTLYRTTPPESIPYMLTALPYYAWDQREPGEMRVWVHANGMQAHVKPKN